MGRVAAWRAFSRHGWRSFWQALAGVATKDLRVLLRDPRPLIFNLVPPLGLLLVLGVTGAAGSRVPVALAPMGEGPYTARLVELAGSIRTPTSPYFAVRTRDPAAAFRGFAEQRYLGVIEVPADFDARIAAGQPGEIILHLHNLNADQAKNYRMRAEVLAWTFNREALPPDLYPVRTRLEMREDRLLEVPFHHALTAGVVPLAVLLGGMVGAGLGLAREFEGGTARLLLLSPANRLALALGKLGAGLLEAAVAGAVVLGVGRWLFGLPVEGPPWAVLPAALALGFYGVALGAVLALGARRLPPVILGAIFYSVLSWIFGGGMAVSSLFTHIYPRPVFWLSRYNPPTYGIDPLVRLVNLGHTATLGRDVAVLLVASAVLFTVAGRQFARLAGGRG